MSSSPKVSFAIAGVQKAGTTALYYYLKAHPEIYMPEKKELHFFDYGDVETWVSPDYMSYEAHFLSSREGQICGEATPIYTFWPDSLERLNSYNPEMKLIIMLRDRVERAYSQWQMLVAMGHEKLRFSQAIREGRERLSTHPKINLAMRWFSYVERGFYAPQIAKAVKLFSAKNVLLLDNSDLLTQPELILQKTYDFLNVARPAMMPQRHFIRPVEPVTNLAPLTPTDRAFLTQIYRNDVRELKTLRELHAI